MITIVKPIGNFCNLSCQYCFYSHLDQTKFQKMAPNILSKVTYDLSNVGNPKVVIIWHGGEPLLAGLDFYAEAVKEQKKYPKIDFENRLQTNATLLNQDWITFFKENSFGIGVSIDGTKIAHDSQRPDLSNNPTFDRIMGNIKLMELAGLRFGLIQTLTAKSLPFFLESLDFFYNKLNLRSWNVNFVDEESCKHGSKTPDRLYLSEDELISAYDQLIDFWVSVNDPTLKIDELDQFVAAAINRQPQCCHFKGRCGNFSCIDFNGNVYACDRICFRPEDILGKIQDSSLLEIMTGQSFIDFRLQARKVHNDCLSCKWQNFCNNGCYAMRKGDGKYRHCNVRKHVFERISSIVNSNGQKGGD